MKRSDCECREPIRVLIVDDHPLVRKGIRLLIQQQTGMVVCGESDNVADALAKAVEARPDVMTVDLDLGSESGLDLLKRIRAVDPNIRILVLSLHTNRWYLERASVAGAHGYVTKEAASRTLVPTIRRLAGRAATTAAARPGGRRKAFLKPVLSVSTG